MGRMYVGKEGMVGVWGEMDGRPRARACRREEIMARDRCGVQPMAGMSISIAGMSVGSMRWHGRPMARASPRGARIGQCRYGMQPVAGLSESIAGTIII